MFKKFKAMRDKVKQDRADLARLNRFVRMLGVVAAEQGTAIVFDYRGVTIESYKMEGDVRVRKFQITDSSLEAALIDAIITIDKLGQG